MFTKPTVFVLGAGASCPYGFPSGAELTQKILSPPPSLTDLLKQIGEASRFSALQRRLSEAKVASIDAFLEHNHELREVAKRAIIHLIAERENPDALWRTPNPEDWFEVLFRIMDDGATPETFVNNKVTFVTFNYDRCLEYALHQHVLYKFNLDARDALSIVRTIPIHHIHGLAVQLPARASDGWSYGGSENHRLRSEPKDIHIVHDQFDAGEKAKLAIDAAERVVFLGFGFHPSNCRRIFPASVGMRRWLVCRTKMQPGEVNVARSLFPRGRQATGEVIGEDHEDALNFLRRHIDHLVL